MGRDNKRRRVTKRRSEKAKKGRQALAEGKRHTSKGSKRIAPSLYEMPNPFMGMADSEIEAARISIIQKSQSRFNAELQKLEDLLGKYDCLMAISMLASHGLTVPVGKNGITIRDEEWPLHQAHVEMIQSLALALPATKCSGLPLTPEIVQVLWDSVKSLQLNYTYCGLGTEVRAASPEKRAIADLQYHIRASTQMVRNWGYFSQVVRISSALYRPLSQTLCKDLGFTFDNAINVFASMVSTIERRESARREAFIRIARAKSLREIVRGYYQLIGEGLEAAEAFIRDGNFKRFTRRSLTAFLLSHYDLNLGQQYRFSPSALVECTGLDLDEVSKILNAFALAPGDLSHIKKEFLFLDNPVWKKPIIRIAESDYYCALPQVFFSNVISALEAKVPSNRLGELADHRSDFLEEQIAAIIGTRFPRALIVRGVKWQCQGKTYETDLLAFIDTCVLVIEAKSGRVTSPALRGAPERLRRHIEELLIAPNEQSRRFCEKLIDLRDQPEVEDDLRKNLPIDLQRVKMVVRASVSLEDFGSIQCNIKKLAATGWLPSDFEPCPTLTLADLESLFDILEHPVQIIHYLMTRQEIESKVDYTGDEMDLLGLYLTTLFCLDGLLGKTGIGITGMSQEIDNYYNSIDAGVFVPKPRPRLSPLFSRLLVQLEERAKPRWTEIGVMLNRVSPDDQLKIENLLQVLEESVHRSWRTEGHKNILVYHPGRTSTLAICFVLYNNRNKNQRMNYIEAAARKGFEQALVMNSLVIAKNLDDAGSSYSSVGLFTRETPAVN